MTRYLEGESAFALCEKLWPLNRSLTGEGNRETLRIIMQDLGNLQILEIPSGVEVYDWRVPKEWKIQSAHLEDPNGNILCDIQENNLHLVGYSTPVDMEIAWEDLENHLHSLPSQPKAIPYVTSYYNETWGFCIDHETRETLPRNGSYKVQIKSELFDGSMTMGELVIPGESEQEIFFSTYICHPSMANNELSGPAVAVQLAKFIMSGPRYFTYRIVFLPETIGSLTYLHLNRGDFKSKMLAGYVLTCVGDDRDFSFLPSRTGDSLADKLARAAFSKKQIKFKEYTWMDRGSDERQYCAPGVDLPVSSIMRSKYGTYPEYHTSEDMLGKVVTPEGLQGSFDIYRTVIELCESLRFPRSTVIGEPMLSKRNLYPTISKKRTSGPASDLLNFLSHSDGKTSIDQIALKLGLSPAETDSILDLLLLHGLIEM